MKSSLVGRVGKGTAITGGIAAGLGAIASLIITVSLQPEPLDSYCSKCNVIGLLLSLVVAIAIAAAVGAFGGRRAARWALEPLTQLRDSLDQMVDDPHSATATLANDDSSPREVVALRDALRTLVARLADSLDAARRFSADAAHELKTPLTVISAELDLLSEEPGLDAPTRASVEKLRSRVASVAKLVERLLALAEAAADRARLTTEAVALEDIARDVIARLAPAARSRVTLRADAPGMVLGDESLLAALLENAIDNALKFSGKGPVDVHISEPDLEPGTETNKTEKTDSSNAAATQARVVLLDVTDDGPGIAPADRARAFEAFFRTRESRASNTSGHGVGLALVAQIVSAHSGTAAFVDVPKEDKAKGARLRVTLPTWSARPG